MKQLNTLPVRSRVVAAALAGAVLGAGNVPTRQPPGGGRLTGASELARVYHAIFDARFDEVPALMKAACGPAAPEACQVLHAVTVLWRIQLDPLRTANDVVFHTAVARAIAATSTWAAREPNRAEAWFYLGGAYGARVQWSVIRGERLAAAREGGRIKEVLERAIALDPALTDAYLGIGLYHYYADVAPMALRMLRWLLLLPGGDRTLGLGEMLRARHDGQLVRSEADYQLHLVYLWYEKQTKRALELLGELQARHPRNPHFLRARAEIEDIYLHDTTASLRSWERLFDAARRGHVAEAPMAEAAARVGMAVQLQRLSRTTAAVEHLRAVIDARPDAPFGIVAHAYLQLGASLDRLGRREEAADAYRSAIAAAGQDDPLEIAERARSALRAQRR